MGYDLRRLARKGLIVCPSHSHRYRLTPTGMKAAAFFTKLDARLFRVAGAVIAPPDGVPRPLRQAMEALQREIDALVRGAKFGAAA
ncbi:MAG: hypothetical protein GX538_01700 [Gammaproteobacteria bacterium]|nr:hypothetical protein [Gammaproteobacteria bacterium]